MTSFSRQPIQRTQLSEQKEVIDRTDELTQGTLLTGVILKCLHAVPGDGLGQVVKYTLHTCAKETIHLHFCVLYVCET